MQKPQLAGTHIVTPDVPRLARFYEVLLGLAPLGSDEYVEFRLASVPLALCSQTAWNIHTLNAPVATDGRSVILDFEVSDVDAERRRLDSTITRFVREPLTEPWAIRSMLFRDPNDNLIRFFSRASSTFPSRRIDHA